MSNALTTYDERWAQDAQAAVAAEPLQSGTWLSARGGQLAIGQEVLPGAMAAVIVLDSYAENTFYSQDQKYDPDNPLPPICYAMGRDGQPMFPDLENMKKAMDYFMPQHVVQGQILGCEQCPMNEWGSAAQGRGKACQNRRRLSVIPAGFYQPRKGSRDFDLELFTDPSHFKSAEIAYFKIPVTSVKNWATYVHQLGSSMRRPPHGVVTRLSLQPHQQFQYEVQFEPVEQVPDSLAEIIIQRHEAARQEPLRGYQPPDAERLEKARTGASRKGGFRR